MSQKQTLQLIYLKFINVAKVSCATNQDTSYCIPNKSEKNKILHLLSKSRPTLSFLTGITSTSSTHSHQN